MGQGWRKRFCGILGEESQMIVILVDSDPSEVSFFKNMVSVIHIESIWKSRYKAGPVVNINSNLAIVYHGQLHLGNEVVEPVHNINTQTHTLLIVWVPGNVRIGPTVPGGSILSKYLTSTVRETTGPPVSWKRRDLANSNFPFNICYFLYNRIGHWSGSLQIKIMVPMTAVVRWPQNWHVVQIPGEFLW